MCLARPQFMDLPQEIKDRIVENLYGYTDDLCACALAHRCLTWAAQRELHNTLDFIWSPDADEQDPIRDEEMYSSPTVAAFVRELSLGCVPHPEDDEVAWKVLARFTHLKTLKFSSRNYEDSWMYVTPEDRDVLRRTFPNVTTLEVEADYFCHVEDFLFFLSAFPNVTVLKIADVSFDAYIGTRPKRFPKQAIENIPCSLLRSLEVSYHGVNRPTNQDFVVLVQKWLTPLAQTVEQGFEFTWYNTSEDDAHAFPVLVRALAPVLGSLRVTLPDSACQILDFGVQYCTRLESLSLLYLCRSNMANEPRPDGDAWALNLLSQVSSPRLKTIMFDFSYPPYNNMVSLNFERVKELLLLPRFAHTKVVLGLSNMLASYEGRPEVMFLLGSLMMSLADVWVTGRIVIGSRNGGPTFTLPI